MFKKVALFTALAVTLGLAHNAYAGSGCCAHGAKADKASMGCAHKDAVAADFTAIEKDYASLKQGVPAADMDGFLKAHEANLEKLVADRAACSAQCGANKAAMKGGCPHKAAMDAAFKALSEDSDALKKGVAEADRAAFLKAHEANLQKVIETRQECMKTCKMKAAQADKA